MEINKKYEITGLSANDQKSNSTLFCTFTTPSSRIINSSKISTSKEEKHNNISRFQLKARGYTDRKNDRYIPQRDVHQQNRFSLLKLKELDNSGMWYFIHYLPGIGIERDLNSYYNLF